MRRSRAAILLLVATLTVATFGGPGSAAPAEPPVEQSPVEQSTVEQGLVEQSPVSTEDPTAVLENAESAVEGEATGQTDPEAPEAGGTEAPAESPSLALADLVSVYPDLSEREQLDADALLARPDGDGNPVVDDIKYWSLAERRSADRECDSHLCVHYVTMPGSDDRTTEDWADRTLDALGEVWAYQVDKLGYRPPPSDGPAGGDASFDVYLANIGAGYYGYCAPEYSVSGTGRASSFCVLDNDFLGFSGGPEASMRVTAAHEFFHAIQYSYDYQEDRWLMEATATWMEERFADSVNDNRQYLKYGQLGKPGKSLDKYAGFTHYGNWLFFEKFSKKYGVGAMRALWNRLDAGPGAPNQHSVQAIRNFLKAHGTTLPKFYAHFAAGNLAPTRAYTEGSAYKATKFTDTFKLKSGRKSIAPQQAKLKHLTSKSYRFKAAPSLRGKWKLRIRVDGPDKKTDPSAVAYVYAKNGKLTKKYIKLNKSGVGSARVKISPAKIRRVTLSLVNASSGSNASKFTFRATVVR